MKSKILKALKWMVGGSLLFLVVLVACWNLIPDEALNPEAAKFIAIATPPAPENNAFYSIYGFESSPELDPHEVGKAIVAAHDRILATEKQLQDFKMALFLGANRLAMPVPYERLCDTAKDNCLLVYQQKREEVAKQTEQYSVYLARIRKIRTYPEYAFALSQLSHHVTVPSWSQLMRISDLVDAGIAIRMEAPQSQAGALKELVDEIASWKRMLQSNDWLLTQMISEVVLKRKYQLAGEIMNKYPALVGEYPNEFRLITAPLQPAQTKVSLSVGVEARTSIVTFKRTGEMRTYFADSFFEGMPGPPLMAAFYLGGYKPNASINRAHAAFKSIFDHLSKSPREMLATQSQHDRDLANMLEFDLKSLFYNPVGQASVKSIYPNFGQYANRVHNLIGLTRLVELQRQAIEKKLSASEIPAFLANAGPGLMDPYTETPMKWDANTKRISFELHNKRHDNYGYVTLETVK